MSSSDSGNGMSSADKQGGTNRTTPVDRHRKPHPASLSILVLEAVDASP
jgi:hypothetical protein